MTATAIRTALRRAGALWLALLVYGCAAGPNFQRPAAPKVEGFLPPDTASHALGGRAEGPAQTFALGQDIPGRWWAVFHSPEIDALVREALANNQDVKSAMAALTVNQELLYAQRGAFLPSIGANVLASRQRNSATLAPPLADNASIFSLYTPLVTISYSPDVFGGIRRQTEAAAARVDVQRAQLDAAYLTLTSNVVQAALQVSSLNEQIRADQEVVVAERQILAIIRRQQQLGQASGGDVATQELALAQAEQALPPLLKQAALERDLLTALLGRYASQAHVEELRISDLTLPPEVPLGLPSELVERRPDIRAAEANLHVASAQVGVAAAARLPNIVLVGDMGRAASAISALSDPANRFWGITAGITQPIFQGGALRHQQRAAEAAYRQAQAQYRSTVILAFQNVADALQALQQDGAGLDAAAASEAAARRNLEIARRQLELGEVSGVNLLNAQQAYQQSRVMLIQARTARFTDTVALFQALGAGDWRQDLAHIG